MVGKVQFKVAQNLDFIEDENFLNKIKTVITNLFPAIQIINLIRFY
jgi:hypothetical protein